MQSAAQAPKLARTGLCWGLCVGKNSRAPTASVIYWVRHLKGFVKAQLSVTTMLCGWGH